MCVASTLLEGPAPLLRKAGPWVVSPTPHPSEGGRHCPSRAAGLRPLPASLCEQVLVSALLMPQGQHTRFLSRNRHILRHCLASRKSPKRSAIAAWNLRRLGQGGFGESSWLKLRACTRLAVRRGWRSILVSDCMMGTPGSYSFRCPGGNWLLVFNCRCGVLLDPGMANMWRRGGNAQPPLSS